MIARCGGDSIHAWTMPAGVAACPVPQPAMRIGASTMFRPTVAKEDRSKMNIVFVIDNPDLEKQFLAACKEHGMVGIKGYRTMGGFRASLYNALPIESVKALTDLMKDFANKKG